MGPPGPPWVVKFGGLFSLCCQEDRTQDLAQASSAHYHLATCAKKKKEKNLSKAENAAEEAGDTSGFSRL